MRTVHLNNRLIDIACNREPEYSTVVSLAGFQ
jgi:hypothetical protein